MSTLAEIGAAGLLRRVWLAGTILGTAGAFAVTIAFAPSAGAAPALGLRWLLFLGSSVHVAATAWFFTLPEIRRHARSEPARYLVVPAALLAGTAAVAAVLPERGLTWVLIAFFGWQFFHFQKQNVGMAALAGATTGAGRLTAAERAVIVAAGLAGTVGLLVHPELLALDGAPLPRRLFPVAAAVFAATVTAGLVMLARRPAARRPAAFTAIYLLSVLFFLPVFLFQSPYAAVAGLTMAHGYQYLLLLGLVAGAHHPGRSRLLSLIVLANIAVLGGVGLTVAAQLDGAGTVGRAAFGAYLGLTMAHFVIDAGLWRLRDEFPRRFLGERVPYLLRPPG